MSKVLVIDDERSIAELLCQALTLVGYNVTTASGGAEGIEIFDKDLFDLVITDIRMPGINGIGVVNHIRKSDRPHTPIIGISGTPWLLEENGFNSTLNKPFTITTLKKTVTELAPVAFDNESRQYQ